jgi:hypothetical protein
MKYNIGKNNQGIKQFITHESLEILNNTRDKGKFSRQQWAKIRKLMKRELNNAL